MRHIEFRAMGCQISAWIDTDDAAAADQLAQAPAWFEAWEQALSRFRPASELMALNSQAAGEWIPVGPDLWQALNQALWAAEWSDGLVTPTLLPAMHYIGYTRSFDTFRDAPPVWMRVPLAPAPDIADWRAIELDPAARAVRLPPGAQLDLGGTAKGWAAEQAGRRLSACGPALVDAGGDVCVSGPRAGGDAWPVSIADPFEPDSDLELLAVRSGCVATSGRDFRRWQIGGAPVHHLIDPRTRWPAQTDVLAATAIAPDARQAEAAAKAALILGSASGLAWLESHQMDGLLVLEDGRALATPRFPDRLWSEYHHVETGQ